MSVWQIGESGTEIKLDKEGRGEITFTVTNTGTTQDRSVLTVTALDGAADSWFTVDEPQRAVPAGQSAQYTCKVVVPAETAPGTYAMQAEVYSADGAPDESSTLSRRVTMVKEPPPRPRPPRRIPWWVYLVAGIVLLLVIGFIVWILLKDDEKFENTTLPTISGTPRVTEMLRATPGEWSKPVEGDPTYQWQSCQGETCVAIPGAGGEAYSVGADDEGRTLQVEVLAISGDDRSSAVSEPTAVIAPAPIPPQEVPDVVGDPRSQATQKLRSLGFQVAWLPGGAPLHASDCDPEIQGQTPTARTLLPPGSQVVISSAAEGCGVPPQESGSWAGHPRRGPAARGPSRPTVSVKVLVVVLIVLVAAFVTVLAVGARQDDGNPNDPGALVDRLGDVAGDPSLVPRGDVSASCFDEEDPDLLVINGRCVVVVRSEAPLRLLGLLPLEPVQVVAPAPKGDLQVKKNVDQSEVEAKKVIRIAVSDGATDVVLSCPPFISQCRARVVVE